MSNDRNELEPSDYHLAVKRREHSEKPWRWEIWAAGHTKAIRHSKEYFATMSEATREGKSALKHFLSEQFPSAA
jgi:hypothetical protein